MLSRWTSWKGAGLESEEQQTRRPKWRRLGSHQPGLQLALVAWTRITHLQSPTLLPCLNIQWLPIYRCAHKLPTSTVCTKEGVTDHPRISGPLESLRSLTLSSPITVRVPVDNSSSTFVCDLLSLNPRHFLDPNLDGKGVSPLLVSITPPFPDQVGFVREGSHRYNEFA